MSPRKVEHKTIKDACNYYLKFIDQSSRIEQITSSFASSLKTTLMLIPDGFPFNQKLQNEELNLVKNKVQEVITGVKNLLSTDMKVITEINGHVDRISLEFKKLIQLTRFQNDRSTSNLLILEHQLKMKEQDISDCQNDLEAEKFKKLENEWKRLHYVDSQRYIVESSGGNFLKILKDFKTKLQLQINLEKEEMSMITTNIAAQFKEFKTKLTETWMVISSLSREGADHFRVDLIETRNEQKFTDLEREYMRKAKRVDGFEFKKLEEIKKKLKLLEEADITESREYFTYSQSREKQIEESEVMNLFQL